MVRLFTAVWLCVAIVSVGGSSRPSSKIVGKWQPIAAKGRVYEFFKDGSLTLGDGPTKLRGTWKFLDDGRLKIETTVVGSALTDIYYVTFDSDTVIFTDSQGNEQKLVKESASSPVERLNKMQDEMFTNGPPDPDQISRMRKEIEKLSPDQRRQVMDHGRENFQRQMDKRKKEDLAAPPEKRKEILDKHMREAEKRRAENDGASGSPEGGPGQAGVGGSGASGQGVAPRDK